MSGWLKVEQDLLINIERICQHIWTDKLKGGTLYQHLRHSGKKIKQYGYKDNWGQISNRISIDDRPVIVSEKTRLGSWEIDTDIGKNHQSALVTIVDRVSKFTMIKNVTSKHTDIVTEATNTAEALFG